MKYYSFQFSHRDCGKKIAQAGHTLLEVMFASAILIMIVLALLSAHLFGLRQNQLVESKSGASDSSRRVLQKLPKDIRSAKMWNIGNMNGTTFVPITNGSLQGTALRLCLTTNGSDFTTYYFDLSDTNNDNGKLMRSPSGNWSPVVLASNLINTLYFRAEDYNGTLQSASLGSRSYKNVIHVTLQFRQFQYPLTRVGPNALYDFYKLEFIATPHLPE